MAEPVKAITLSNVPIGGSPHRCAGQLVPAALGDVTKFERFFVQGGDTIRATVKLSAVAGTCTIAIYPILSDGNGNDDTTGTRNTVDAVTSAALTTAQGREIGRASCRERV